jgi:hypothetical protein
MLRNHLCRRSRIGGGVSNSATMFLLHLLLLFRHSRTRQRSSSNISVLDFLAVIVMGLDDIVAVPDSKGLRFGFSGDDVGVSRDLSLVIDRGGRGLGDGGTLNFKCEIVWFGCPVQCHWSQSFKLKYNCEFCLPVMN